MAESDLVIIGPAGAEDLVLTRAFDGPRVTLWRLWTMPLALAQWFGPADVHVDPASVVVDAVPGGRWDLDMVDNASERRYPLRARLVDVVEPVFLYGVADAGEPAPLEVALRVWFREDGHGSAITLHQGPFTPEQLEATKQGWLESFRKLDTLLSP